MKRREKMVTVWAVLHDTDGVGPAADGTMIARFRGSDAQARAEAFASRNTVYGRPAKASPDTVPARIADRWSYLG